MINKRSDYWYHKYQEEFKKRVDSEAKADYFEPQLTEKDKKIQSLEAKVKELECKSKEWEEIADEFEKFCDRFKEKAETLEALLIEACGIMATHDLDWIEDFLNKPEIKKLLEGVKP